MWVSSTRNTICIALLLVPPLAAGCGHSAPVAAEKQRPLESEVGLASFYGAAFHGKETSSGEIFDMNEPVAAHPAYPAGTLVRVTNLENGRAVDLRVIDRGPVKRAQRDGVIIDVSKGAARALKFVRDGRVRVRVDVLAWGDSPASDRRAD